MQEMKGRIRAAVSLIALSAMVVLLSGCASIFAPATDKITIDSIPQGASVYDGANLLGKTPITHTFKRATFEHKTLTLRQKGYRNQDVQLGTTLETASLWNFGFITTTFGVTSWGIDAVNGNMVKYSPDSYMIELQKEGPSDQEEQTYLQRLRLVACSQGNLQMDIARGDGEYLRAYFEIRQRTRATGDYQAFLRDVSRQAPHLLSVHDPVELCNSLEVI
jgi:hypothetical protein